MKLLPGVFVLAALLIDVCRAGAQPLTDVSTPTVLPATTRVASVLPESNQWVFDRARTFIFLSASKSNVYLPNVSLSQYDLDFGSDTSIVPRLVTELKVKDWSRWTLAGRYEVGFVHREASLSSRSTSLAAENADLMALPLGAGPILKYSVGPLLTPFIGYLGDLTFFRLSSSLSGAELQGLFFTHGPIVGLELNSPDPDLKLSLLVSYQKSFLPAQSSVARSGDELSAGLGWFF